MNIRKNVGEASNLHGALGRRNEHMFSTFAMQRGSAGGRPTGRMAAGGGPGLQLASRRTPQRACAELRRNFTGP